MTLPQQNSPRIKTPYPYLLNLMSNYLENNILSNTVKINGVHSRMWLKLRIKVVAFFLGHPVYIYFQVVCLLSNHQPISITGADPGFSWGGGGAQNIIYAHAHHNREAQSLLWPGSRAPKQALEALGFFLTLSRAL